MTLSEIIGIAKELGMWIHEQTNEIEHADDRRTTTGLAILQQSQDISDAIVILIESGLPGPAFALARPQHETYVRGLWLLNYASDDELNEFFEDKCPKLDKLKNAIDDDAETGGAWIRATTDLNLKDFHSLTHGGIKHVLRRVTQNSIEPSYPEEELVRLMHIGIETRIAISAILLALSNNQEGIEKLDVMAKHYRAVVCGI